MKPLKTILVAEDELDIQMIIDIALEDLEVHFCQTGKEALNKLQHITPDLLLLDVMMPEMDGPQLLKELSKIEKYATLPAIFLTAKGEPKEIDHLLDLGALAVLTKPFSPLTLGKQLNALWQAHTQKSAMVNI